MRPRISLLLPDPSALAFRLKPILTVQSETEFSLYPRLSFVVISVNNPFRKCRVRDSLQNEGEGKPMDKKITRRAFCSMLLALPFPARAQQAEKMFRIGFLDVSDASSSAVRLRRSGRRCASLDGWRKNITIEYRFAEEKNDRLAELAADLVRLKIDVIVCASTAAALAAKRQPLPSPS